MSSLKLGQLLYPRLEHLRALDKVYLGLGSEGTELGCQTSYFYSHDTVCFLICTTPAKLFTLFTLPTTEVQSDTAPVIRRISRSLSSALVFIPTTILPPVCYGLCCEAKSHHRPIR